MEPQLKSLDRCCMQEFTTGSQTNDKKVKVKPQVTHKESHDSVKETGTTGTQRTTSNELHHNHLFLYPTQNSSINKKHRDATL